MNIGQRITQLRSENNMTMAQLSKLTNISQPVISKLETGYRKADIPILEKICSAFNISLYDFFSYLNDDTGLSIGFQFDSLLKQNGINTSNLNDSKKNKIAKHFAEIYLAFMKEED